MTGEVESGEKPSWEETRFLTNLEIFREKLLQVLAGEQPELEQKLDGDNLRQLKQQITLRCRLQALQEQEIGNYIVGLCPSADSART